MSSNPIVITGSARTPIGELLGCFASVSGPELGAVALKAAIERSNLKPEQVEQVIMGCVLSAGIGQAPARQAAIAAGIPNTRGAMTVNKMCGSGMQAMMLAHDQILAGSYNIIACGGLENMSKAPYLLDRARAGMRMGHGQVLDHMFLDGLEDAYEKNTLMGVFAERTAQKYDISRKAQDDFALESLKRAQTATDNGSFKEEIAKVTVTSKKGTVDITVDELPQNAMPEKIPTLKPAFAKDGTVTAANSSGISDGAAAHILMREQTARDLKIPVRAYIRAHATYSHEPAWFTTAPIGAIELVLKKAGWTLDEVDLFEINEAFAVVTLAAMQSLKLPAHKVNVHGGACALGHPIGASGARIMATLLYALEKHNLKRGIATLCIGGGEATAIAIERP